MSDNPIYLGDAVYAHLNRLGDVQLTTGSHRVFAATNVITLEPEVMQRLLKWYAELTQ